MTFVDPAPPDIEELRIVRVVAAEPMTLGVVASTEVGGFGIMLLDESGHPLQVPTIADAANTIHALVEAGPVLIAVNANEELVALEVEIAGTALPSCGDGVLSRFEGCDDGVDAESDGCSAACTVELGFACTLASPAVCRTPPELGTLAPGEGIALSIASTARLEFALTEVSRVFFDVITRDGALVQAQLVASSGLQIPVGSQTRRTLAAGTYAVVPVTPGSLDVRVVVSAGPVCGDSVIDLDIERCDDGAILPGDGCSPVCLAEPGWTCTVEGIGAGCVDQRVAVLGAFAAGAPVPVVVGDALVPSGTVLFVESS